MPWDCSLNKDFNDAIDYHVLQTHDLKEDHELKFSYTSPVRGSHCLKRVYEHNPRGERIVHDVNQFPKHLVDIMEAEGCVVRDIGNSKKSSASAGLRSGKRGLAAADALEEDGGKVDRRGGTRKRNPQAKVYKQTVILHPDAVKAKGLNIASSLATNAIVEEEAKEEEVSLCCYCYCFSMVSNPTPFELLPF